jgi:hypothetical protein
MARLTGSLHTLDDSFRTDVATLLRTTAVQVSLGDERSARAGAPPDIIFVDGRDDLDGSLEQVERLRAAYPVAVVFFMAAEANPDLILQAMRAGANEFFAWQRCSGPRPGVPHRRPEGRNPRRPCSSVRRAAPEPRHSP